MVTLDLNITIDEFIASTDSEIEVYMNDCCIGCLSAYSRNFEYSAALADEENNIVIKRKYLRPCCVQEKSFVKRILSSVVSLFLIAGTIIEPFDCPYECEEKIKIFVTGDLPKITIACTQNENEKCPNFQVRSEQCLLHREKSMMVSEEELQDVCGERRQMIYKFFSFFTILLAVPLALSVIHQNLTTMIFLLVIWGLIFLCTVYSLINLKREFMSKIKLSKVHVNGNCGTKK